MAQETEFVLSIIAAARASIESLDQCLNLLQKNIGSLSPQTLVEDSKPKCPECGSPELSDVTTMGCIRPQYQCYMCKWIGPM